MNQIALILRELCQVVTPGGVYAFATGHLNLIVRVQILDGSCITLQAREHVMKIWV